MSDQTCRICGKRPEEPHTGATMDAHLDHYARYGHSLMCPSPAGAQGGL